MAREVILSYPDFNKPFEIFTDASNVQLGSVIVQDGKPIAFYSRKLNPAQTRYTTTERELLSIVETLKEFRNILLGQQLIVHTDHENLTFKKFNSDRVMRWRLFIEEYSPDLRYVKGDKNIMADALSRLEITQSPNHENYFTEEMISEKYCYVQTRQETKEDEEIFPLSYQNLEQAQSRNLSLLKLLKDKIKHYHFKIYISAGNHLN